MSSYCWACGGEFNFIHIAPDGDKRCEGCFTSNAAIVPGFRGRLTKMDRLPLATRPRGLDSGAAIILASDELTENEKQKQLHAHLASVYGLSPCRCAVCK